MASISWVNTAPGQGVLSRPGPSPQENQTAEGECQDRKGIYFSVANIKNTSRTLSRERTQKPRNHTALMWDSVPRERYPETQEPRNHTALRGSLLSRGVVAPWGGDPQLSSALLLLFASSLVLFFVASSNERVPLGRKYGERSLLDGPGYRGMNPGMAAFSALRSGQPEIG